MRRCSFLLVTVLVHFFSVTVQDALDDYIQHYEPLHYDRVDLHARHHRVRRAIDEHLYLKFQAYGRPFHLKLKPDNTIFTRGHKMKDSNGHLHNVDTSFIYSGYVIGEPKSSVHVSVIDGLAQGHVRIPGDTTYHIESAARFFENPPFHSVIYSEKHLNLDPYRHKREASKFVGSCAYDSVKDWMKKTAESASEIPNRSKRSPMVEEPELAHEKYSQKLNRQKRSTIGEFNTCYLYLRSDPMLWNYVKFQKYRSQVLTDERAKEEIVAFFASHVAELKKIYADTVFETYDKQLSWSGIDFQVQRSSIMTNATENCGGTNPTLYCSANIDVSNFLNLNSKENHDEFCLAYVFTYRDFTHGTLGLAWVGSDTRAAGGVCERYKEYPEGTRRVSKSLNTGIVTIVNYGKPVPARVSQLTFAHEVGHNFGSPHDSGPDCAPFGTNRPDAYMGNYIMFASATLGDKDHNDEFSRCSKDNITRVLDAVVNQKYGKIKCFNKSDASFCGNSIVEPGEECDCGYVRDCEDQCCYAKGSGPNLECKLKENHDCSPTKGPCCGRDCKFIPANQNLTCRRDDECTQAAYCGGNSAACPAAQIFPNMTFCNSYSQVCLSGDCVGSVCKKIGWEECYLTSQENGQGPSREELCYVACMHPQNKECISSFNSDALNKAANKAFKDLLSNISNERKNKGITEEGVGIQLPPGSPCDNYKGYCDVFHKCRGVDAEGPLARLKNLIFNPQTLQTIRDWIVVNWWAVMLMAIGLVVVMGVFIKVCAVHTPSSNPRKPAARKLTLPRRTGGQGHRNHQGNKPQGQAAAPQQRTGYGEPPPPYSGPSVGGPSHGKGPRYKGRDKRMRDMELQRI